jgi:thioredoxin reductase (NADPH)
MEAQASKLGAETKYEQVTGLSFDENLKQVTTTEATYHSSALIIATGTQRRKLGVPGEMELLGRGVSYCPVCDGAFFKGLKVAVVWHGKDAVTDALFLADIAKEVLIVRHEKEAETNEQTLRKKIRRKPNVRVVNGRITSIIGENLTKAIRYADFSTQRETQEDVNGVFISLCGVPMTAIVKDAGIDVDPMGCIRVDRWQRTSIEGVFAAGDCTCGGMQVVTAAGEGAMAAIKASVLLKNRKK